MQHIFPFPNTTFEINDKLFEIDSKIGNKFYQGGLHEWNPTKVSFYANTSLENTT